MAGDVTNQIREARGKFAAMAATYTLGVFNDSFFRQSAMLLAVGGGVKYMQGWIMAIFTIPYLLFASPAGWLADRFPKRRVVIGAKLLELLAMLCGAVGICAGSWGLILAMVFVMGLQSCLFSPALNGSIPELYPSSYVTRANAILKVVVTAGILAGITGSGVALSREDGLWRGIPLGPLTVAFCAVAISVVGVVVSLGVPRRPAAAGETPFPWRGPLQTFSQLAQIGRDRLFATIVATDVFVWFVGAALIPLINVLAMDQFGYNKKIAAYMVAVQMVGVAVGGVCGSCLAKGQRWYRFLPVGLGGMGVAGLSMAALPMLASPMHLPGAFVLLAMTGVFGGTVLIPCEAFVQIRPSSDRRGATIAAANFAIFSGIIVSGLAANAMLAVLRPTTAMGLVGAMTIFTGLCLWFALAKAEEADS